MMLFQTLDRIKEELDYVRTEENGCYVSVNVFEWEGRGVHIRESHKNYDVEINLYNDEGERVDNWVTEIVWVKELSPEERIQIAERQAKDVLKTVRKWFKDEPVEVARHVKIYSNREEIERYDHKHKDSNNRKRNQRIEAYSSRFYTDGKRKERVL
jgi:hypothetical protein